jgi:hypothetical protein
MIGQIGGREMGGVCVGEMCMGYESWKCGGIIGIDNNGFQLLEGIRFGWIRRRCLRCWLTHN